VAELYTYLNAKHFEEVLRKIAERKPDPGLSFTFEYGKTPVTY
jgi:hypothetical protein